MLQALTRLVFSAIVMVSAAQTTPAAAQDKTILISFSKASYPFFEAVRAHAEDEARQLHYSMSPSSGASIPWMSPMTQRMVDC